MIAGLRLPASSRNVRVQLLAVFGAQLEDVADLNGAPDFQRLAAFGARLAGGDRAQVRPARHLDVALDGDVPQVEAVLVRAGGHVVRAAATVRRHRTVTSAGTLTTAPRLPGFAPSNGEYLLRRRPAGPSTAPAAPMSLVSFNWSSPRIRMMTGLLSAI